MAPEHNFYFGPFCPQNTISCGAAGRHSQYIGLERNGILSSLEYDPGRQKATEDSDGKVMSVERLRGVRLSPGNVTRI